MITVKFEREKIPEGTVTSAAVWRGDVRLGSMALKSPRVIEDDLVFGDDDFILWSRDLAHGQLIDGAMLTYHEVGPDRYANISYGRLTLTFRLFPDDVQWGDGPPHPTHLQVAKFVDEHYEPSTVSVAA